MPSFVVDRCVRVAVLVVRSWNKPCQTTTNVDFALIEKQYQASTQRFARWQR